MRPASAKNIQKTSSLTPPPSWFDFEGLGYHCTFRNVVFEQCALCDALFVDCTFENNEVGPTIKKPGGGNFFAQNRIRTKRNVFVCLDQYSRLTLQQRGPQYWECQNTYLAIQAAQNILITYCMMMKAHLRQLPQSEEWAAVRKQIFFFVSAGEYMERQLPLLGERPRAHIVQRQHSEMCNDRICYLLETAP